MNYRLVTSASNTYKIALVSYATHDIKDYASYSFAINQAYAEHNMYKFYIGMKFVSKVFNGLF